MKSKKNAKNVKNEKNIKNIILLVIVIVVISVIVVPFIINEMSSNKFEVNTKSSLERIQNISELSSVELIYNAVARKYNEKDKTKVDYYVKYNGNVKVGIDFSKIDIEVNETTKLVTVTLPEIIYTNLSVDPGTLDYIFEKAQKEDANVSQEAIILCEKDLKNRVESETKLKETAKENISLFVQGFMEGYMNSLGNDYKLEVKWVESNE